jgi:hypothetical protein
MPHDAVARAADVRPAGDRPRVTTVCPYVARWLRGHDDFDDWVERVRSVHLEAARRANAEADGTAS